MAAPGMVKGGYNTIADQRLTLPEFIQKKDNNGQFQQTEIIIQKVDPRGRTL